MKKKQSKTVYVIVGGALLFFGGLLFTSNNNTMDSGTNLALNAYMPHLTVYKSPTCGCCGNYVSYLKREGYDVDVIDTEDVTSIKQEHGVPMDKSSCHTTVVGDGEYIVEGHVPVEGIEQLLALGPDVRGIGMAGMPAGSPGMPGAKRSSFDVYSFDGNGGVESFMSL